MRLISAEMAKRIAMMMVVVKRIFSMPRLVWNAELKLSLPPKAPPTCAPVRCKRIAAIKSADRMICIYGRIACIGDSIA